MGKMTERERILKVFQGEVPHRVPYMLDLSHLPLLSQIPEEMGTVRGIIPFRSM